MDTVVVSLAGEITQGQPLQVIAEEVTLPSQLIDPERELLYRVAKKMFGAVKGDYLIVELRTRAHTGELVLVSIEERMYLGRWWGKHKKRELQDNAGKTLFTNPTVVGVVNLIARF